MTMINRLLFFQFKFDTFFSQKIDAKNVELLALVYFDLHMIHALEIKIIVLQG